MNILNTKNKREIITFWIIFCFFISFIFNFLYPNEIKAQNAISLSISPPILEITIQPGKVVKEIYTLSNNGGDTLISPRIVYFTSEGQEGGITLTDVEAPNWIEYDKESFNLKGGTEKTFSVTISPPENTEEIDHFVTLIFETKEPIDLTNQNSTSYKSIIGSNILITISMDENPNKSAKIVEFSSPKIIDSLFGQISYTVTLANNGNSFWKPNGKIVVNNNKIIKIAPFNVLSGYKRNISCLDNENLTECKLQNTFLIGKYKAILEFSLDNDGVIYRQETTTFAFPFVLFLIVLLVLTIYKYRGIFKIWQKIK